MTMHVCDNYDGESISYGVTQQGLVLPTFWVELEFAFLINLLRKVTKKHMVPCRIRDDCTVHIGYIDGFLRAND